MRGDSSLNPHFGGKTGESQENCKVQGKGVRSMFSANDCSEKFSLAGRKMDQTPTLQFTWGRIRGCFPPFGCGGIMNAATKCSFLTRGAD